MTKIKALKAVLLGAALTVVMAVPAFAQTTPGSLQTDIVSEATPYITGLVALVVALFGAALIVVLARKASGMATAKIRRS